MTINAGKLRERITIQQASEAADTAGQLIRTWSNLPLGYRETADIRPVSGGESRRGKQIGADADWLIVLRYRDDITTLMRCTWGDLTLNFTRAYDPDGRRKELWIEAKES